jgi:hypothetical protein
MKKITTPQQGLLGWPSGHSTGAHIFLAVVPFNLVIWLSKKVGWGMKTAPYSTHTIKNKNKVTQDSKPLDWCNLESGYVQICNFYENKMHSETPICQSAHRFKKM